jgi:hypothetical protein
VNLTDNRAGRDRDQDLGWNDRPDPILDSHVTWPMGKVLERLMDQRKG